MSPTTPLVDLTSQETPLKEPIGRIYPSLWRWRWWGLTFLLAALVLGVWFFVWNPGHRNGLNRFYPSNTAVFIDFEPSATLLKDRLAFLSQKTPNNNSAPLLEEKRLLRAFNRFFQPHVALGFWPASLSEPAASLHFAGRQIAGHQVSARHLRFHVLAVLPLADETMSFKVLMSQLGRPLETWHQTTHEGMPLWETPSAAVTRFENCLLVADNKQVLINVIDQRRQRKPQLDDNPAYASGLQLLPKNREGTFLANMRVLSALTPKAEKLSMAIPTVFGSLQHKSSNFLQASLYAPIQWESLQNKALQKDVQKIFSRHGGDFQVAQLLPADMDFAITLHDMDAWLRVMFTHLATPAQKQQIAGAQMMADMVEMDFQKDLVGLLSHETVLAGLPQSFKENRQGKEGWSILLSSLTGAHFMETALEGVDPTGQPTGFIPIFLFSKTREKEATLAQLIPFTDGGFLPIRHKTRQMGQVTVETFSLPGSGLTYALAPLKKDRIAFAPGVDMNRLLRVHEGATPALAKDTLFQGLSQNVPKKGNGFFYANLKTLGIGPGFFQGLMGCLDTQDVNVLKGQIVLNWQSSSK